MASESTALPSDPAAAAKTEPPARSERAPRPRKDGRLPGTREKLATLPDIEDDLEFEPHDTIPAPPWLDDEVAPPRKNPEISSPTR